MASGDPLTDRVVIWTRVTTHDPEAAVGWVMARDADLRDVVAEGETTACAHDDHTVSVDVAGLEPGRDYFYAFTAAGARSPVARTRTLPGDLGDYIYEASNTPPASQTPGTDIGRPYAPLGECRTLAEHRTRYAHYHRDPDAQALHHALPLIATIDDHELADGAWAAAASEHREDEHGPWEARRDAAFQARWEWLPARRPDPVDPTRFFRCLSVAGVADIVMLDIRSRRDEPVEGTAAEDPSRSMLGAAQRAFAFRALEESRAPWRFLATPSIMSQTWCEAPPEVLREAMLKLKLMDSDGSGPDCDQWDGYPAERRALLAHIREQAPDTVVLSADIHASVAAEVHESSYGLPARGPVTVEFTSPSLTSQNLDDKLSLPRGNPPSGEAAAAMVAALEHVKWCEFDSHGYVVVDATPDRVRAEWWHLPTVLERAPGEELAATFEVRRGAARLERGVESDNMCCQNGSHGDQDLRRPVGRKPRTRAP